MGDSWAKVKFKDVPLQKEFGFGDYFHWKNTDTTAVCEISGEVHDWALELEVYVELVDE